MQSAEALSDEVVDVKPIAVKAREVNRLANDLALAVKMLDDNRRLGEENAELRRQLAHYCKFATHITWCQSLNLSIGKTGFQPRKVCNCGLEAPID